MKKQVGNEQEGFRRMRDLVNSIAASRKIVEMKYINGSIRPVIDLLPCFSSVRRKQSLCFLSVFNGVSTADFDPIVNYLLSHRLTLRIGDCESKEAQEKLDVHETIEQEIFRASSCALDYAILCSLQDENASSRILGCKRLTKIRMSKHISRLSISFLLASKNPTPIRTITISMGPQNGSTSAPVISKLREAYLNMSENRSMDVPLSQILLETL